MKISVVINTFNAEEFFGQVLESLKDFDEIVVCDMHSADRTVEIAEEHGCRVVYHDYAGYAEPARAYAIAQAANTWVLVVDADELVPAALREYLYDFAEHNSDDGAAGLRIPRKNYFMGRLMRSEYPDLILRFMRRDKSHWPTTIHSMPIVDGLVEAIPAHRRDLAFIHLDARSLHSILAKMNTYTDKEVPRRIGHSYTWWSLLFNPWLRFAKSYILKGGFLDGLPGFILAREHAYYKFVTISKVIEAKRSARKDKRAQ